MKKEKTPLSASNFIDKVYVLSVKTFTDRISHIQKEMSKNNIHFEFIFSHDIPEIDDATISMFDRKKLTMAQISLTLKHIEAWRDAVKNNYKQILVFEDDVLLSKKFNREFKKIIIHTQTLTSGYLIFLGGADTKIPASQLTSTDLLLKLPIATTEGYITDIEACKIRLEWLAKNKIILPADHLIKIIDESMKIENFWSRLPIVEQGSVNGLFISHLDSNRRKHSIIFNALRYQWNKLQRRKIRRWFAISKSKLKL